VLAATRQAVVRVLYSTVFAFSCNRWRA